MTRSFATPNALREYDRIKFRLAQDLREAEREVRGTDQAASISDLQARLAEDRFNVGVVGRFSRGKTSLLNALLRTARLPVGVAPITSAITVVKYGNPERVAVYFAGSSLPLRVGIDQLGDYVSQEHNPDNSRNVDRVEISLPAELLLRGFHFVDTPGVGSASSANTQTTEVFLPEIDAFVVVTSHDGALSSEELAMIETAITTGRRLFIVINKDDLVSPIERDASLAHVAQTLKPFRRDLGSLAVFAVSARRALLALETNDTESWEASGVPALERSLTAFFAREKGDLIASRVQQRLDTILHDVRTGRENASINADSSPNEPPSFLLHAVGDRECVVCHAVVERVIGELCRYQFELSEWETVRVAHAQRGGFCSFHTWQYASLASPRGIARSSPELLRSEMVQLAREISGVSNPALTGGHDPASAGCFACCAADEAEANALAVVVRPTADADQGSLCRRHLRSAASLASAETARRLYARVQADVDSLCEDLERLALRQDALRGNLVSDSERLAPTRALAFLAGHPALSAPPKRELYV